MATKYQAGKELHGANTHSKSELVPADESWLGDQSFVPFQQRNRVHYHTHKCPECEGHWNCLDNHCASYKNFIRRHPVVCCEDAHAIAKKEQNFSGHSGPFIVVR